MGGRGRRRAQPTDNRAERAESFLPRRLPRALLLAAAVLAVALTTGSLSSWGAGRATHSAAYRTAATRQRLSVARGRSRHTAQRRVVDRHVTLCASVLRHPAQGHVQRRIVGHCERVLGKAQRKHRARSLRHRHATAHVIAAPRTSALPAASPPAPPNPKARTNSAATKHQCKPTASTTGCISDTEANLLPALAPGGDAQIKGKVTSAASKAGIEGIEVCASREAVYECVLTDATGDYDLENLAGGEYRVSFYVPFESALNYLGQYYNDKPTYETATPIDVSSGATVNGIDAALQTGGQVKGTVTDAGTKAPIAGIEACAYVAGEEEYVSRCAATNASGEYDIAALPSGSYTVEFFEPFESKLNYLPQYYNGKPTAGEANPVSVTAGVTTSGIDAALHPGGQLTGTVTDASTKAAIAQVEVCGYDAAEGFGQCTKTGSKGEYDLSGLPSGNYRVEFAPNYYEESNLDYLRQYYDDRSALAEAEEVSVTAGATTPNINAALHQAGQISGTVTSAAKAKLSGIEVCASEYSGEYLYRCTTTSASGEYTISGLTTGTYLVAFTSPAGPYAPQFYSDKPSYFEAQPVSVTTGDDTSAINAVMQLGAEITGTVTDFNTKAPVGGAEVCAVLADASSSSNCTATDAAGEYALAKLGDGEYRVEFAPEYSGNTNYLTQYFDNQTAIAEANLVSLSPGGVASGINAALHPGGEISGTVTAAVSKAPVGDVYVCAESTTGQYVYHCAYTTESGEYTIPALPTGSYRVSFQSYGGEYALQYYDLVASYTQATDVAVTAGVETQHVDAALELAGRIEGVVRSVATKAPAADVEVCALETGGNATRCQYTNEDGEYVITPLASGEYKVEFAPDFGGVADYATQYYNDKPTFSEANVVTVPAGAAAQHIDAELHEAGAITGTVTDASTTKPIEGITVCAQTYGGEYLDRCAQTAVDGTYKVTGLATGEYQVSFSGNGHNYVTQYYKGTANYFEGTHVAVTNGETTTGINAAMEPGAAVTGTVTTKDTSAPIANISVCAYPRTTGYVACGFTNSSGEYSILALKAGEYNVAFNGDGLNYVAQYYNGKTASEPTALTLGAGTTTPNINAVMEVGAEISGTVATAKTKEPLSGIEVSVQESSGGYVTSTTTNSNGEYLAVGIPTGEFKVQFYSGQQEYRTQYYNDKASLGEATPVPTTAGGNITTNINAAMVLAPPILTTPPTITGTAQEGHTLAEQHGGWKNHPTEYTYKWLRCNTGGYECISISEATQQTYKTVFDDVGHTIRVEELARNESGPSTPSTSDPTATIAVAPPENTKAPAISGVAQQGETLSDVPGVWSNEPTTSKYQWLQCDTKGASCEPIGGANEATYVPVAGDVGHTLRLEETAENGAGAGPPATSAATAEVVPPIPVNTKAPTITGTAQQGKVLTEHHGTWEYSPTEYEYEWLRCNSLGTSCLPIGGAHEQTYEAQPGDVGGTLRVEEFAKNAGGTSAPATSAATAEVLPAPPVNTFSPTITGTAQQGKELTEQHGGWENNPTSYKVEWLRCNAEGEACVPIGASEETYVATAGDVGHTIRVTELAKNAGGTGEPATSSPTSVVVPPVPVNETPPTITGTDKQGESLTAHHGSWSNEPSGYEDKWLRCDDKGAACEETGTTGETYLLATSDVGHTVRVEETATNDGGTGTPATSEPSAVVAAAPPVDETLPTITGTAQDTDELTAEHGSWSHEPTQFVDTWLRCNESGAECNPTGVTDEHYVLGTADIGHTMRVEETAENGGGPGTAVQSDPTAVVIPLPPAPLTPPTISGEAEQGKTLTEHPGTWEHSPTGTKLEWLQCDTIGEGCLPIGGAVGPTYEPKQLDIGHTIRVEEIASNAGGDSPPAVSEPTGVVTSTVPANTSPPTIVGTAETGLTLADQHGSWTNEPTSYEYQWVLCNAGGDECETISGATDPSYLATPADVGHTLEVQETARNEGGPGETAVSAPSSAIAAIPLHAVAGEDVTTTVGVPVPFDGTGSTPAAEIETYAWQFGDGESASGVSTSHTYSSPGTYTAQLTVSRGGEHESAAVTVQVEPAPVHAAVVEVTDGHSPLPGATVLYIGPSNTRIQATTGSDGKATLPGLPDGTDTVYAYENGYQPAVGKVAVSGGGGEATIPLSSGEVVASTLKSHEMTLKEIEEAGINVNDPANQNVYEFEVRLAFIESPTPPIEFHCYINSKGEFVGGCLRGSCGCGGGGGGWGGWGGGGGGGGAGGPSCTPHECVGGGIVAVPAVVDGRPLIQWLVLRGKATVLKQFFEVTQVVQNLSPEPFKLAQGHATLNIPPGMSLAPTPTPQTTTQTVSEVPGDGSAETNWIVRGDSPGEYLLSANYESQLEPFGAEAPVDIEARLASPLKVWGVEALELHVEAEEGFLAEGQPYRVHVSVTNKADITLNNVAVEIFAKVHERFIFQPEQDFSETVAELKPGESVSAPLDILVPDDASEAEFNPALSSAHFVGEEIHPGVGIETLPKAPLYNLVVNDESASKRVHLAWQADPNAEGYEVFSTPTLDTAFTGTPESVKQDPNGSATTLLPANATEAYAPYDSDEPSRYYAVTSIVHGKPTLDHLVALSSFGSGAEDWGYCFSADGGLAYGVGPAVDATFCLVQSGNGAHDYLMAHGAADLHLSTPPNLNTLTTSFGQVISSCAGEAGASIGAIAFEGPEEENPGDRAFGAVNASVNADIPFTKIGVGLKGAAFQSRDLSTFGIYYGYEASFGLGCLPSPIAAQAEPDYTFDSLELTGSLKDAASAYLQGLQLQWRFPFSPLDALGFVNDIAPPIINYVKKEFPGWYVGLSGATTAPTAPTDIANWTVQSSGSDDEVVTPASPDGTLSATGRGIGSLGVGEYDSVPTGVGALQAGSNYFDVKMSQDSLFDPVSITDCDVAATDIPQWWTGSMWERVSTFSYEPATQCVRISIGDNTKPNISQLTGTVFGVGPEGGTAAPTNAKRPEITGTLEAGKKVSCSTGEWTGEPTYTYQWLRDGSKLATATSPALHIAPVDAGHTISCVVTATNSAGKAEATSAGALVPRPGCGDYWINPAGGSWTTGADWSNGKPPASGEGACITTNGTYDVELSGAVSVRDVQLGGNEGTQSITVASRCAEGAALDASEGIDIGKRGSITLTDGDSCPNSSSLGGAVVNEGTLTVLGGQGGSRSVGGDLTNAHSVALGAGADLHVSGRYSQGSKATVETAIAGSSSFGSIAASGPSQIEGGSLRVKQIAPFKAALGASFTIITGSTLVGTVSKETGGQIGTEGRYYEPTYTGTTVRLDVARATLSLLPASGPPGATVSLHGTGYLPGDTVIPTFTAGANEEEPVQKETYPAVAVNSDGEFEVKIVLPPSARPGKDKIAVNSREAPVTVRQVFKVT
jgi:hypothetical protein